MESLEKIIADHYPEFTGIHPAANLFPLIEGQEFADLVADIGENGLKYPIDRTPDGLLLDGRNRLRACYECGQEIRVFTVYGDPIAAVVSANIRRRQMSAAQLAFVGDGVRDMYDKEAKQRKLDGGIEGSNKAQQLKSSLVPKLAQGNGEAVEQEAPAQKPLEQPQTVAQPAPKETKPEYKTKARQIVADLVGTSGAYIDMARNVRAYAPQLENEVVNEKISLTDANKQAMAVKKQIKAATEPEQPATKAKPQTVNIVALDGRIATIPAPAKPQFNRTNGSVDWASWTWNPVTGCLHECSFCYARAITHSDVTKGAFPFGFEPAIYEYRLTAPANTNIPKDGEPRDGRVFVGSMADLFGKWVPDEWIEKVFNSCMDAPQWEYMFLTKWPKRYSMLASLPKAWFGASVIQQSDVARVEAHMKAFETTGIKWISLEPMTGPIVFNDLSWCDLVVIGAQTATNQPTGYVPAKQAHFEWVFDVVAQCKAAGVPYYLKPNLENGPGMTMTRMEPRKILA